MNVGENIKKLRELRNYSQSSMSKMLGLSQKTYSNIENAGNKLSIEMVEKVAIVLNVSFSKIIELNSEAILNNSHQTGGLSHLYTANSYNYLNDKNIELYEKLLLEKDSTINTQKELIAELKTSGKKSI